MTTHLKYNETYDESSSWCGLEGFEYPAGDVDEWYPDDVDCVACLTKCLENADRVAKRLADYWACGDCGDSGFGMHACPVVQFWYESEPA